MQIDIYDDIILREVRIEDAKDIYEYAKDEMVVYNLTWETHKSIEETIEFVNSLLSKGDKEPRFVIYHKKDKKVIGMIDCFFSCKGEINERCEIGYVLNRNYWNRGYMTKALKVFIAYIFENFQTYRIQALANSNNIGSLRVMEKCNMKEEGMLRSYHYKNGRFIDLVLKSILRSEYKKTIAK